MSRTVLFVTYDYPPVAGIQIRRINAYVNSLLEAGYRVVVLTNAHGMGRFQDQTNISNTDSESLTVLRIGGESLARYHSNKASGKALGFLDYLTAIRSIHQLDVFSVWYRDIRKKLNSIISEYNIDLVFTTSPPHSTHIIGYRISSECKIPWVVDIRDSIFETPIVETSIVKVVESYLLHYPRKLWERRLFETCSHIVFATPGQQKNANSRARINIDNKSSIVMNGYDGSHINHLSHDTNDKMSMVYTGTMLSGRSLEPLLIALSKIYKTKGGADILEGLRLTYAGGIDSRNQDIIDQIGDLVEVNQFQYLKYEESIELQRASDVLLIISPCKHKNSGENLTGKVFEYLASRRYILGIACAGDMKDLIESRGAGVVVEYNDYEQISSEIVRLYEAWKSGGVVVPNLDLSDLSRKSQNAKIIQVIDGIILDQEFQS